MTVPHDFDSITIPEKTTCMNQKLRFQILQGRWLLNLFLCIWASGGLLAQNTSISLHVKDKPLKEVLGQIEKDEGYIFLYKDKTMDLERKISLDVRNTGRVTGSEVAQLYVGDKEARVPRPEKELRGYEKVRLKPGETKRVEVSLPSEAFSFYDMDRHDFVIEPGCFTIMVGSSARDIRLKEELWID